MVKDRHILVIDGPRVEILHFETYLLRMSICRFCHLKDIIKVYQEEGDAERTYNTLVSGNWAKTFFMGKLKSQILNFKEHVRLWGG